MQTPLRTQLPNMKLPGRAAVLRRTPQWAALLPALAAGLAAAGLAFLLVRGHLPAEAAAPPAVTVVVAARDIPARTLLSASALGLRSVPVSDVPDGAAKSTAAFIGKVSTGPIPAGDVLTQNAVSVPSAALGMAFALPPTLRAVTVATDPADGVELFVRPEDHVDILATDEPGSGPGGGANCAAKCPAACGRRPDFAGPACRFCLVRRRGPCHGGRVPGAGPDAGAGRRTGTPASGPAGYRRRQRSRASGPAVSRRSNAAACCATVAPPEWTCFANQDRAASENRLAAGDADRTAACSRAASCDNSSREGDAKPDYDRCTMKILTVKTLQPLCTAFVFLLLFAPAGPGAGAAEDAPCRTV